AYYCAIWHSNAVLF
nr:immunoglobulin light chain junction region [Macaca mulatta]